MKISASSSSSSSSDISAMASSPTVFFFFLVLSLAAEWCQSLPAVAREEHAAENNCVHRMPKVGDSPAHVELEPRHRLVKRSLEHQMRIKVFYHESVERLGRQQRSIVKKVRNKLYAEIVPLRNTTWWPEERSPTKVPGINSTD